MNKSKLYPFILVIMSFILTCCSQNINDSYETEEFKKVKSLLSDKISNKKRAMLSIADENFLIVTYDKNVYTEYFISKNTVKDEFEIKKVEEVKTEKVYAKMFNKNIYQDNFITFDSDFYKPDGYKLSSGNLTYFVFKDEDNKRYGEAALSVFINPNPIDQEVYLYMINKILYYNNQE